jgi:hypothetical protein
MALDWFVVGRGVSRAGEGGLTERAYDLKPPLYILRVPGPPNVCRTCDCLVHDVHQRGARVCADCGQAWRFDAPVSCKCGYPARF